MIFDNFFLKAILLSVTIHMVIVCGGYFWHMPVVIQKHKTKGIEISVKSSAIGGKADLKDRPVKPAQRLDLKNAVYKPGNHASSLSSGRQASLPKNFMMVERKRELISASKAARKISVTPVQSEKINNPAYAAYYEMVRSRIRDKAYEMYPQVKEGGSVYLTFIISSDGVLKTLKIIEDRSKASVLLKDIALKSIQDCVFPTVLKGMTLPEYPFNIEIMFQAQD